MYHCHLLPITMGYDHILPGVRLYLHGYLARQFGPFWEDTWRDTMRNAEVLLLESPQHILAGALVFSVSSDVFFIHATFLHREWRASILLIRALRTIEALAGARGCCVVRCFIDRSNERSLQTVRACGFEELEETEIGFYMQARCPIVEGKAANHFSPLPVVEPAWIKGDLW